MKTPRRRILQFAATMPFAPVVWRGSGPTGAGGFAIAFKDIQDDWGAPMLRRGDAILVDTEITRFDGPGLYLYPDWGQPRVYRVTAAAATLIFHSPGGREACWTMELAAGERLFAGKAVVMLPGNSERARSLRAAYLELAVPDFPNVRKRPSPIF